MRAFLLLLLMIPAGLAQTPTPAQGRDYIGNIYRVLSVDSTGKLNVNVSAGGGGCPGTVGTPCRVAGIAADGSPISGAPVQVGAKDTGGNARYFLVDTSGRPIVVGAAANGAAAAGNPVLMCGSDGTNCRTLHTDASGNLVITQTTPANLQAQVTGAGAAGAAVSGNPILICGTDGTNCRALLTDTAGRLVITQTTPANLQALVTGAAANGAAVSGNPVSICGSDGTNCRTLHTDSSGNLIMTSTSPASLQAQVTGAAANGTAVAGNPVLVAGSDGTNARSVLTDSSGRVEEVGAGADGAALAGNPVRVCGSDGTNCRTILVDSSGRQVVTQTTPANLQAQVTGAGAAGAAVSGNPVLVCGTDGTNCRSFLVGSDGRLSVNEAQVGGTTIDTNSGVKSAGTQRVVIATDQPAFTTPMPVTQTTPANLQAQVTGAGAAGAAVSGNPVLVCGTDGTNCRTMLVGTDGRLSVNEAQVGGTTIDTNSGVKSAGTQRIVIATDQPTLTNPQPITNYGAGSGATLTPVVLTACDITAIVNVTAGNTTEVVALVAGRAIHVCSYVLSMSLAGSATWKRGTGTNCGTGTVSFNGPFLMSTNSTLAVGGGLGDVLYNAVGEALCLTAVTGNVQGMVTYAARP